MKLPNSISKFFYIMFAKNHYNCFLIPRHTKSFVFPIPHKSLGMPIWKGIERWGTLV